MSTRATIRIESKEDGRKKSVRLYHHCDGHPEGVGRELKARLAELAGTWTLNSVKELIQQDAHYEDTRTIHGDEEFFYLINCENRTIACWAIPASLRDDEEWGEWSSNDKERRICIESHLRTIPEPAAASPASEPAAASTPETVHVKLEHGDLIAFTESEENVVEKVEGTLKAIVDGDDDKTCFVFTKGGNFTRLYLDNNGKPMTRLLRLLCSRLDSVRDDLVVVTSVKNGRPMGSRLQLQFIPEGVPGIAPLYLSETDYLGNPRRIESIKVALGLVEVTGDEAETVRNMTENPAHLDANVEQTTAGELTDHAPVVVGGISGGRGVSVHDTREVVLVAGFPIAVTIHAGRTEGESDADFIHRMLQQHGDSVVVKQFLTIKARDAFKEGVMTAISRMRELYPDCGVTGAFTEDRAEIARILQSREAN